MLHFRKGGGEQKRERYVGDLSGRRTQVTNTHTHTHIPLFCQTIVREVSSRNFSRPPKKIIEIRPIHPPLVHLAQINYTFDLVFALWYCEKVENILGPFSPFSGGSHNKHLANCVPSAPSPSSSPTLQRLEE